MTFKCSKCGAMKLPQEIYTSHGVETVYNCPRGCRSILIHKEEPDWLELRDAINKALKNKTS